MDEPEKLTPAEYAIAVEHMLHPVDENGMSRLMIQLLSVAHNHHVIFPDASILGTERWGRKIREMFLDMLWQCKVEMSSKQ